MLRIKISVLHFLFTVKNPRYLNFWTWILASLFCSCHLEIFVYLTTIYFALLHLLVSSFFFALFPVCSVVFFLRLSPKMFHLRILFLKVVHTDNQSCYGQDR